MAAARMRISLFMNMAGESGTVPARLRRRVWRTAADVWRMVNERLSLLSLCREVAGMTQVPPGREDEENRGPDGGPIGAHGGRGPARTGERSGDRPIRLSGQADPHPRRLLRGRRPRRHLA